MLISPIFVQVLLILQMYRPTLIVILTVSVIDEFSFSNQDDQPPSSVVAYLNDYAEFDCSIRIGIPRIFWFINGSIASSLPMKYNVSFSNQPSSDSTGVSSTLRILALKDTNNTEIRCAVDTSGSINLNYFPSPALLLVQGMVLLLTITA